MAICLSGILWAVLLIFFSGSYFLKDWGVYRLTKAIKLFTYLIKDESVALKITHNIKFRCYDVIMPFGFKVPKEIWGEVPLVTICIRIWGMGITVFILFLRKGYFILPFYSGLSNIIFFNNCLSNIIKISLQARQILEFVQCPKVIANLVQSNMD
jgi:hypothetical protein